MNKFSDWLGVAGGLLGFLTTLVLFVANIQSWVKDPNMLHNFSIASFSLFVLGILWFFIKSSAAPGLRWASLVILYIFSALFCLWMGSWQQSPSFKLISSNIIKNFNFEDGLPKNMSLGICDNTPNWYDVCYEAPKRFEIVSSGFTGEKSLGVQIEILPQKEAVYSLRFPVDPPVLADAVSAHVYLAKADIFSKITLAVRIKGENVWIFSDMKPSKDGWLYFLVDLQGYKGNKPASDIAVDEIHLDTFIKKGSQITGNEQIFMDDLEIYYPLSPSLKTGP
jgi:hypothetical protein